MGACVSGGKWATWTCVIYSVAVIFLIPFCSGHAGHDHNHDHDHRHGGFVYKAEENNQPSAQHVHDGKKDIHIQPHAHDHHHHHHDHDHMHDHDHDHPDSEPPSFKYSKQANSAKAPAPPAPPSPSQPKAQQGQSSGSKAAKSAHAHSHSHSHPAGHSHGHAHGHDHGHSHAEGHDHGHSHPIPAPTKAFGTSQTWLYALGSTLGISIAPFVILFAIPISSNSPEHEPLLRVLLSFAAGGLLGDAFLHLIPHSIPHSHGHDHSDHNHGHEHVHQEAGHMVQTVVGAWVLAGIIAFFVVEKVIRHMKGGHHHGHGHTHLHGQSHESTSHNTQSHQHGRGDIKEEESQTHVRKEIKRNTSSSEEADLAPKNEEDKDYELVVRKRHREAKKTEETHAEPVKTQKSEERKGSTGEAGTRKETSSDIKIGGYLNLAADFAHNFTDGLAIGASYLAGQSIGMVTTFTILFHEVPHEIGDFALLVQSGCSKPKAMALQLVTALGAFTGCLVSLAFGSSEVEGKISWVLPFTAGGFIYIATVSVIPELLQESKISQTIKEVLGLLTGIGMMVAIAWIEEQQHHH